MIDPAVIREIRARVDIVEIIGKYVPLKKTGSRYTARCPFHDEKSASFSVSPDSGLYFCFGCKASGDSIRFVQETEGLTFPEAVRQLAELAGVEIPDERDPGVIAEDRRARDVTERLHAACEAAAAFYEQSLNTASFSELARGALEERGISLETATAFRLGYAPASWHDLARHLQSKQISPADAELAGLLLTGRTGFHDRFRHRLMFPVLDRAGKVVAFSGRILPLCEEMPDGIVPMDAGKYINSPETPIYHKGALLYGLANARTAMRLSARAIIVEGNFDVVQMHQHGFTETVAPLGTSFTDTQAKLLRRFAESVVLVFDGDDAGRKAARASHAVCAKAGLLARVGVLPPKADPDSYLRAGSDMTRVLAGPSIVEWLIRDAGANAGDSVPERVVSLRALAPTIAAVKDVLERDTYVRLAARTLYLDELQVREAVRECVRAEVPGAIVPSPFPADPRGRATRTALETILAFPETLATESAGMLLDALDGAAGVLLKAAWSQWQDAGKLDGAVLVEGAGELAPWVTEKLASAPEGTLDAAQIVLADVVTQFQRMAVSERSRGVKKEGAKAGVYGDAAGEQKALEERLRLRRGR